MQKMNERKLERELSELKSKLDAQTVIFLDAIASVKILLEEVKTELKSLQK